MSEEPMTATEILRRRAQQKPTPAMIALGVHMRKMNQAYARKLLAVIRRYFR